MAISMSDRIEQVHAFLSAQQQIGLDNEFLMAMEASQAKSLVASIQSSKLDRISATDLIKKASHGPFSAASKKQIVEALNAKVSTEGARDMTVTQTCKSLCFYLTKSEWDVLSARSCTRLQKVKVVVGRMIAIGLYNPTEQTRKDAACIVGLFEDDIVGKDLCDDIRFWLKRLKSGHRTMGVVSYPSSPDLLEKDVYALAYGSEGPAPDGYVDLSRWSSVSGQIALRRTNRLCVGHQASLLSTFDVSQQLMAIAQIAGAQGVEHFGTPSRLFSRQPSQQSMAPPSSANSSPRSTSTSVSPATPLLSNTPPSKALPSYSTASPAAATTPGPVIPTEPASAESAEQSLVHAAQSGCPPPKHTQAFDGLDPKRKRLRHACLSTQCCTLFLEMFILF
jgi:hypothetical protein